MSVNARKFVFLFAFLFAECVVAQVDNGDARYTNLYRRQLQQLTAIMDVEREPCDDFFQHACGGYAAAVEGNTTDAESHVPPFLYNKQDRSDLFEQRRGHFGTAVGQALGALYADCKAQKRSQWVRMLRQLDFLYAQRHAYRQWPFLHHQWQMLQQQGGQPDWVHLLAEFEAHGVPMFLDIFFAEQTIYVAPVESICPTLRQFTERLRPLMRRKHPQVLQIIVNELWFFCRELEDVVPENESKAAARESLKLENATLLLLDEYFTHFFGTLGLSTDEVSAARKIPIKLARLTHTLRILQKAEPHVIVNYVLWQAMQKLHYDDCYEVVEEFERLLHAEYWQWHAFKAQISREVAMATFLFHTTRFQRHRKRTLLGKEWDKFLQVRPRRKDLNMEHLIRQHAQQHLDATQLAQVYIDPAPQRPGAFYANLLLLRRLRLRHSFYEPVVDDEDHNGDAYFMRQFLHFIMLILQRPLFHYYVTQGYEMWHISELLYTTDGYLSALDCLQRQERLHWQDSAEADVVEEFQPPLNALDVEHIYHFHASFRESYRDYQFWLQGESFAFAEDFILEYFDLNSPKVLFYAATQLYCSRNDALYRRQINRSFMNMPEFQSAFNCSTQAALNPPTQCMVDD